jgi:hypothetical protein
MNRLRSASRPSFAEWRQQDLKSGGYLDEVFTETSVQGYSQTSLRQNVKKQVAGTIYQFGFHVVWYRGLI